VVQKIVVSPEEWANEKNRFRFAADLEAGDILFFPTFPFAFPQDEIDFLLTQKKPVAYHPQMVEVLRNYSNRTTDFLALLLPPYAKHWSRDNVRFCPFSEPKNHLLHLDSTTDTPLCGSRILRFFTNINPRQSSRWVTSQPFEQLAMQFGGTGGVPFPGHENGFKERLKELLNRVGVKLSRRSPYDHFLSNMDRFLKGNDSFQKSCPKDHWEFPPHSCWVLFTDQVSHAVLSDQCALEQTLIVPQHALVYPDRAPISILEQLSSQIS
jgi:hypothetical protein